MLHWLLYFGLVAFGAGLVLTAIVAAVATRWVLDRAAEWLRDYSESQAQLTAARVHQAAARARAEVVNMRVEDEKRGKAHWGAVKASEALTDIALQVITDGQVMSARLENLVLRAEYIRYGGNPDAPWSEIVNWKNKSLKVTKPLKGEEP